MTNYLDFPLLGYGVGLRPPHYSYILENKPDIDWFEIISENYMDTDGRPRRMLEKVLEHYPVVMHGVSLSIGTVDPINSVYLKKLKDLSEWVKPAWISDHLCWTGVAHKNTHDLLPVPYTEEALSHIIDRIKRVQDVLDRPLTLENPSTYLEFSSSSMPEWEFIARMAEGADCNLLLDANNVYVSCYNHRWDSKKYIDALPLDRVVQIHLAGHTNKGTHIVDTHDDHVTEEVWNLYGYIVSRAERQISTMVEWDANIPEFPVMLEEVNKARHWGKAKEHDLVLPHFSSFKRNDMGENREEEYVQQLNVMQNAILDGNVAKAHPESWIVPKPDFSPKDQLGVYISGYRYRLFDIVYDDYLILRRYLGRERFRDLLNSYVENTPSSNFNISRYVTSFPEFVKNREDEFSYELSVIELHVSQLFDARETPALDTTKIQGITPESFMRSKLHAREALVLLPFSWNVNTYFNDVMNEKEDIVTPQKQPSYVAVFRHNDTMWRLDLEELEYMLLSSLFSGLSVEEAMNACLPASEDESMLVETISLWFAKWVNNGLLSSLEEPHSEIMVAPIDEEDPKILLEA